MFDGGATTHEVVPALGSHEELEQCLSRVPPGDTARGFVFTTTLKAVRDDAEGASLERCITAAEGGSFIPFFNYPMRSLLRLFYTAAWELSGKRGGFERAMWHLGARSAPDFLQSTVGRALLTVSGASIKRLVGGIPVAYPTIYGHGSCKLNWTGEKSGQLHLQDNLLPPPFIEGAMLHVLQATRVAGLSVQVRRVAPTENVMTVSWD
jgi:uncharacterized protein (TIGR02265 family)